jgi:hypothetical protein
MWMAGIGKELFSAYTGTKAGDEEPEFIDT